MNDISGSLDVAQLAPSDLLGLCLGAFGAFLVLVGAYYASVLINKDPRDIEPWQKLATIALLLTGFVLSLAGLSGALWDELTPPEPQANAAKIVVPSGP